MKGSGRKAAKDDGVVMGEDYSGAEKSEQRKANSEQVGCVGVVKGKAVGL